MSTGLPVDPAGTTVHPSDSTAQQDAEPLMVAAVAEAIGTPLSKQRVSFDNGSWCEVDGVSADGLVLVETFAHQGKMIGGQLKTVSDDALNARQHRQDEAWRQVDRRVRGRRRGEELPRQVLEGRGAPLVGR